MSLHGEAPDGAQETEGSLRVVLADDAPLMRELMRYQLEAEGAFEVTGEASDGSEAVALAQRLRPDGMVLDLSMPGMDGLEASQLIRSRLPETGIVILSSFEASRVRPAALAAGADAYIEKGAPASDVGRALSEAIARRRGGMATETIS